jgi:plasmid stabilization system protein ParE
LTIRISNDAAEDPSAAARYLSERNPRAAADLVAEVLDLFARLDDGFFEGPEQRLRGGMLDAELASAAIPHLLPQARRLSRSDARLPPGSTADYEIGSTKDARGAGRWAFEKPWSIRQSFRSETVEHR